MPRGYLKHQGKIAGKKKSRGGGSRPNIPFWKDMDGKKNRLTPNLEDNDYYYYYYYYYDDDYYNDDGGWSDCSAEEEDADNSHSAVIHSNLTTFNVDQAKEGGVINVSNQKEAESVADDSYSLCDGSFIVNNDDGQRKEEVTAASSEQDVAACAPSVATADSYSLFGSVAVNGIEAESVSVADFSLVDNANDDGEMLMYYLIQADYQSQLVF